jgi:hypothetical protein
MVFAFLFICSDELLLLAVARRERVDQPVVEIRSA